ncbi:MAG: S41 family peptidase [Ruminococcus sp.]|nr:S41 family peptidase [Candidatus Apopatosoma intestinale]
MDEKEKTTDSGLTDEKEPEAVKEYADLSSAGAREPRKISIALSVFLILLAALIAFQSTFIVLKIREKKTIDDLMRAVYSCPSLLEMINTFDQNYIYDVDSDALSDAMLHTYAYYSGDKYSAYYNREEWASFTSEMSGNMTGIGVYVVQDGDAILVTLVMNDSPAFSAGIQDRDRILAVDGKTIPELGGYSAALDAVRGKVGTNVVLTVDRGGTTLTITVTRNYYSAQTVIAKMIEIDGKRIGYINITDFYSNTPAQFVGAMEALTEAGCAGIVFDVRDNPGGELSAICEVLDYLLPEGPIVNLFYRDGEELALGQTYYSDANEVNLPMAVLVNGNTASAAELFTASLKDYGKATVVGTKTYGKGCGQSPYPLSTGGYVMVTSFLYTSAKSDNYDGIGIIPDIEIELSEVGASKNYLIRTLEEDNQLQKATDLLFYKIANQ